MICQNFTIVKITTTTPVLPQLELKSNFNIDEIFFMISQTSAILP